MKITDKIKVAQSEGSQFYSFEYFPPKTEQGVANLCDRLDRMARLEPKFVSFTWGAGGSTFERTVEMGAIAQGIYGLETCMHLTCTNMAKERIDEALNEAKRLGIQNILALRGDPPRGQEYWSPIGDGFVYACDLVAHIRQRYGSYFCIGVAGYPERHMESPNEQSDLRFLKAKIDAGADFIISQMFFDVNAFLRWKQKCHEIGITVPIIAGIMPIHSYQGFKRITGLCKAVVPEHILKHLDTVKSDDQAVKDFGVKVAIDLIRSLSNHNVDGFHISTLNLEKSVRLIVERLGFVSRERSLTILENRNKLLLENSALRPPDWDEFPNGRWGDARSPAYGNDAYGVNLAVTPLEALRLWGSPTSISDVTELFILYISGKLAVLPWSETPLQTETDSIRMNLLEINQKGFWTVSSQPAVNGRRSEDSIFGWGPERGYVYQKAFLEFFVSEEALQTLLQKIEWNSYITYYASNRSGGFITNIKEESPNAVTWGVFPGKEIVQPTIIERVSFEAWKDEAFRLWIQWADLYPPNSASQKLLNQLGNEYWLCNIVHNDFQDPLALYSIFSSM